MSEWLKEHAWKVCIGETLSRVRIPLSPRNQNNASKLAFLFSIELTPGLKKAIRLIFNDLFIDLLIFRWICQGCPIIQPLIIKWPK